MGSARVYAHLGSKRVLACDFLRRKSVKRNYVMATIAQQFGEFVSKLNSENMPPEVIAKAKSCLLYGLGVAMAAHDSRQAQISEAAVLHNESLAQVGSTTIVSGKQR